MSVPPGAASAQGLPVLFLSGAGLPAWVWDDVRAELGEVSTHVARRPRGPEVSLADCADAAAEQAPWEAFVVVAHSLGGAVAVELMARHGSRVVGVLGVAAVFPLPGRSYVGSLPVPARHVLGVVLRVLGTRPPAKAIRAGLAQGVPDAAVDRLVAEYDPEPLRVYRDATSARVLPAARGYLRTAEDAELGAAVQRAAARSLEASWTEESMTGHLPMLQDPAGVARVVRRLLAEVGADGGGPVPA